MLVRKGWWPATAWVSVPQIPTRLLAISASPAAGVGTGCSSSRTPVSGSTSARRMTAVEEASGRGVVRSCGVVGVMAVPISHCGEAFIGLRG
ncbi:hypothetical protein [Tessaracoccus defluvii]|uniref:Uncharacterized protein n=1 Tax=Tessaracoccus defluvii TaxID=1285901 RepID=A0A7H0HAY6_9ACTN|nr:hypothetical protein [Tessaracoccus defluvii]QNP57702.1 hypothetical protein H9L22_01025 [Tessaracoccus defluvii]